MIQPALKDDAFLADVRAAAHASGDNRNRFQLWWLGQSGFLVHHRQAFALIDPYLSDSLTRKYANTKKPHVRMTERVIDAARLDFVNVISSSHNHTDHLDADTLQPLIAAKPQLPVIVPAANVNFAADRLGVLPDRLRAIDARPLGDVRIGPFVFRAIPAAHDPPGVDDEGRNYCLGYVISVGPWTIYHSGDTTVFDDLAERLGAFDVDVALLPINGKLNNMNGADAARLAHDIRAKIVIPMHYEMFEFNTADPRELFIPECEKLGQPYRVLRAGERFSSEEIPKGNA